jgi:hypothetical protein
MDDTLDEPTVEVEVETVPNGEPDPYDVIRSAVYDRLLAEDPDRPQLAIMVATIYAKLETADLATTTAQLRQVFATLDHVFGGSGGGLPKMLAKLAGKAK